MRSGAVLAAADGRIMRSLLARHSDWILIVAAFAYYLTYFNYGLDLDDEGFLLLNASSVLKGQWPMADFFSYEPLSYFLLALFFKILGEGVFTERIMLMLLILVNVWLIHFCARRVLSPGWAWLPSAIYAFAPGPWYKVFFISHMLVSLTALILFIERPGLRTAILAGVLTGIALASRFPAGAVAGIVTAGYLMIHAWHQNRTGPALGAGAWLWVVLRLQGVYFGSIGMVLAGAAASYAWGGKLALLLERIERYYLFERSIAYVNATSGIATVFSPAHLIHGISLEMWVYATGMVCCFFNLIRYGGKILRDPDVGRNSLLGFAIAGFGIASLGYTYYYVWNSRMLSSFAIVYINYFLVLRLLHDMVQRYRPLRISGKMVTAIGLMGIAIYLGRFIVVQNYSGSFTTRIARMSTIDHPLLRGIHIYAEQKPEILALMEHVRHATPEDYLVSGSEATTMSYLSGLPNPTYYRLFLAEFAPRGEQERAIQEFERFQIRFFVARRSQFMPGGGLGSNLQAYAPGIRAYLLENYRVNSLGGGFVLLERKRRAAAAVAHSVV